MRHQELRPYSQRVMKPAQEAECQKARAIKATVDCENAECCGHASQMEFELESEVL